MRRRQITILVRRYPLLETSGVAEPHLPLAWRSFDGEPTWIDVAVLDKLATEQARTAKLHFGIARRHLTRHKISYRWRERAWQQVDGFSYDKRGTEPASG